MKESIFYVPGLSNDQKRVVELEYLGECTEIPHIRKWTYTPVDDYDYHAACQPEGTVAIHYYPPYASEDGKEVETEIGTQEDIDAFVRHLAELNYAIDNENYQIVYGIVDSEDRIVRVLARRAGTIFMDDLGLDIELIADQDIAAVARRQFMLEEDLDIYIEMSDENQVALYNELLEFCGPENISHIEHVISNNHYPELDPFILMTAIVRQWAINHGPAYIPVAYMASVLASSHAITNRLWADNNNKPSPEVAMAYKYAAKPIAAMWEMFNIDWNLPR